MRRFCIGIIFGISFVPVTPLAAQTDAEWTAVDGDYSAAGNWSTAPDVPCNDGTTYNVTIAPTGADVLFDLAACTVDTLDLGAGTTFTINLGNAFTIDTEALIGGGVFVDSGSFTAPFVDTGFTGTSARATAASGAQVVIPATTYQGTGVSSGVLFSATGVGTLLDLSALTDIDCYANHGGSPTRIISATDGGRIDLSSLESIRGGWGMNDDRLDIMMSGGGSIDLRNLRSVTAGNVRFAVEDPTFALPALTSAVGMSFSMAPSSTLDLPALTTHYTGGYDVPPLGVVNADVLGSLTSATLAIGDQGTFNAPVLTMFNGSTLTLGPDQTLNVPAFAEIDDSKLYLSGGVTYAVAADVVSATGISSGTIYSAEGVGTVLDLSAMVSFDALWNHGGVPTRTIAASDGGVVDLSGLTTMRGGWGINDDRLDISMTSGGEVDLTALQSITGGNVRFVSDAGSLTLPMLTSAVGMGFSMVPDSTLELPALLTHDTGGYDVPTGGVVNAADLHSLLNATLAIGDGGTFNAPSLTKFNGSTLTLGPNQTLNAPLFTELDNGRIHLSTGSTFAVAASSYIGTGVSGGEIFSARGAGTVLDLSSFISFNALYNHGGVPTRTILGSDNGSVDLSGLQTLEGGWAFNDDRLDIVAEAGGTVDISTLPAVAAGRVRLRAESAGQLLAGAMLTVEHVQTINTDGIGSLLDLSSVTAMYGSGTGTVNVSGGATLAADSLEVVDGLAFTLAGPSTLRLAGATTMTGTTFNYNGGTISGDVILVDSTLANGPGGTGAARFTLRGECAFSGHVSLGQTVVIQGGGYGDANVTAADGFVNSGTIILESINGGLASKLFVQNGQLENAAGGTISLRIGTGGNRSLEAELVNRGSIDITTADNKGTVIGKDGANHTTSGSLTINATELDLVQVYGDSFTNLPGGIVAGVGALDVSACGLVNQGIVRPGSSAGELDIVGDYTQTESGVLEIEIGGPLVGDLFDVLDVSGTAVLAGTLEVDLIGGYVPAIGDSFQVLAAGAVSGEFDSEILPELPAGSCWDVSYSATAVTLMVLGSAVVEQPVPQTLCEGDQLVLEVSVDGNVAVDLQWRKDGEDLPGEVGASLVVDEVTVADGGVYDVVVTNTCGEALSDVATLVVNVPPVGDIEGDCDVDLDDAAVFVGCLTGPVGGVPTGCEAADFDGDGVGIDLADFAILQNAFGSAP